MISDRFAGGVYTTKSKPGSVNDTTSLTPPKLNSAILLTLIRQPNQNLKKKLNHVIDIGISSLSGSVDTAKSDSVVLLATLSQNSVSRGTV